MALGQSARTFALAPSVSQLTCVIDQVCMMTMAGYWPKSVVGMFMDQDAIGVCKHAKTTKVLFEQTRE